MSCAMCIDYKQLHEQRTYNINSIYRKQFEISVKRNYTYLRYCVG